MKKKIELLFCLCVFVCGMGLTSCSSDDYEPSDNNSKEQEVREEIMNYAEDYDVNIQLKDNMSYSNLSSSEIDSLKDMIRGFSSIKGTFRLVQSKKNGKCCAELKSTQTLHPLTRAGAESATFGQTFDDLGAIYTCSYCVYWTLLDNGRIEAVDENGSISCNRVDGYSIFSSNRRYSGNSVILSGSILFNCVRQWFGMEVSYSGSISGETCDLTFK